MSLIIDISHHQEPKQINYDQLAKQVKHAIVRTQYGSKTIDRAYKTHHAEFRKRGVSTASYAWVRGVSVNDMQVEATDFYNRTKDLNPSFWWLDVEEQSMSDMRNGVSAYVRKLREWGAKKVGLYIAHHLYNPFNLNMDEFDAVWIPRYGLNNGEVHKTKPAYPCDIWQYTSLGHLPGYDGALDLNQIISDKPLSFFTGESVEASSPRQVVTSSGQALQKMLDKGIIKGYEDGSLRENEPLTLTRLSIILDKMGLLD